MTTEALSITLGLGSAAIWGAGDFSGGLASRRCHVLWVIVLSQAVGGLLLAGAALALGEAVPETGRLVTGALAGIFGVIGLFMFYSALARGRMGVAAPISAVVGAVVPIAVAWHGQGLPESLRLAGFAAALIAVWLLAKSPGQGAADPVQIWLAALSGIGFGLFFAIIGNIGPGSVLWPLAGARVVTVALVLLALPLVRPSGAPKAVDLRAICLVGLFDATGNTLYALAAQYGRLDVAAVLGSLYPASTILLAWLLLREKLTSRQWLGAGLALTAVALIAG